MERLRAVRRPAHFLRVGDDAPGAQDVVRVLGTLLRHRAAEHDGGGLLDGELGPFDEVREVRLEEGERRARFPVRCRGATRGKGGWSRSAAKSASKSA